MKTPLLLTLLLAAQLAHAENSDTTQCDRVADPLHPGNPPGVGGHEAPPQYHEDSATWDALRLACENSYTAHPDTPRYAYQLARLYYARDYNVSAEKYLKTAAEQGDPVAQSEYGKILNDQGFDGTDWQKKAAAQGIVPAMEDLGDHYDAAENLGAALEWYEKAAEAGNARAAWKLGDLLQPYASEHAHDWYQKAAAGGELRAALRLGDYYRERDPAKARTYYQAATALGEAEAHYKLAELLRASDPAAARAWYRKAALTNYDSTKSDAKAATALGDIWYSRSDSVPAQMALAAMFENGEGVEADPVRARQHYRRAIENYEHSRAELTASDKIAVALAYQKHADLADADTPAEERKADYRQSLRFGNDAAIDKLRALGEPADDINRLLDERKNTTTP